jgi:EmrB/QacA subfamily drug resistance transporter
VHHPYHLIHVPAPTAGEPYAHRWAAVFFLCLSGLLAAFDMSVTNVALPAIAEALRASTSDLQLIVDAYSIVLAGLVLLGGGLADRYGRKGIFLTGLLIFALASIAGAFSCSALELIVARAFMGLGAALALPPTLSILTVLFPPEERGKAIAVWAGYCGVGVAAGPIISGFLVDRFWWGAVFLISVPCCAIAALGTALLVPTSRRPHTPSLDWTGAALSVVGLAALLYGIIRAPGAGWLAGPTLAALLLGLLTLAAFVLWELRTPSPMFDVRVFAIPEVSAGATALLLIYLTYLGMLFVVPQYLQVVSGHSPLATGLMLLPMGVTFSILTQGSPRLARRFGVRATLVGSMGLMALGLVVLSLLRWFEGFAVVGLGGALFGAGMAIAMPPASTVVINALPADKAGDGSDVNLISRQLGGAFGVAVVGSVFAVVYAAHISGGLGGMPPAVARGASRSIADTLAVAQTLPASAREALTGHAIQAFMAAAQTALLVAAGLAVLAVILALVLLRRTKGQAEPLEAPARKLSSVSSCTK